jgi:DNA-binding MarR family transcriptional regulator
MTTMVEAKVDAVGRLAQLEVGELNVKAARELMVELLTSRSDAAVAAEVYASCRAWVGRMLRSSMAGDDLRAWYNLLKGTSAQFRGDLAEWAIRINVLGELVFERVGMAETRDQEAVLSRRHARAILNELLAAPGWRIGRADLRTRLGLEQANLTRVCTMLMDAGLISRSEEGRTVSFALTASGAACARPKADSEAQAADANPQGAEWELTGGTLRAKHPAIDEWARFDQPGDELPLAA